MDLLRDLPLFRAEIRFDRRPRKQSRFSFNEFCVHKEAEPERLQREVDQPLPAIQEAQSHAPATAEPARPAPRRRLGVRWLNHLRALFGTPARRRLAQAALFLPRIRHWEAEYSKLSDDEVRQKGLQMRGRARGGEPLDALLPEVYGLVCVASVRHLGLRPYDVQLAGGVVMHHGGLGELATGEGKTSGGRHPTTPWGQPTKGFKTRRRKDTDRFIVQRRKK